MIAIVLNLIALSLLSVPAPFFAQTHQADPLINIAYDQKTDKTTVGLVPTKISGPNEKYQSLHMAPSFSYSGTQAKRPEFIDFELKSVVRGRLDTDLYVQFVIEGEKIFLSSNRWAIKRPVPGRVWMGERLVFRMPYEIFAKVANAKSVEIKFDAVRFPVSEEHLQALRKLLKHMDPGN